MGEKSGRWCVTGGELVLSRSFAAILFALATVVGLPTAVGGAVALAAGDWRALGFVGGGATVSGMLGWLGALLWTCRPIPGWFIAGFLAAILLTASASFLAEGRWVEAAGLLALAVVALCQPGPIGLLGRQGPSKPAGTFDELA